jgi:hypothetical protein
MAGRTARRALLAALAFAVTTGVSAAARGSASEGPGWHALSVGKAQAVYPLGSASGRVWFVVEGFQGTYTAWSARVAGSRLTSLVSTPEGKNEWLPSSFILGSSLVNCCAAAQGGSSTSSSVAPLLANGKVGAWSPLAGDPEGTARAALTPPDQGSSGRWLAQSAVTTGGRTIWSIIGHTCPPAGQPHQCTLNGGGWSWFAVCCTASGQPVDLTSQLTNRFGASATDSALGRDSHGRVWLAWLDRATSKPGIAFKLVQLDPATLQPLSVAKLDHLLLNDVGGSRSFSFACADRCRLVYQSLTGAFIWGGTGKPVRLWKDNFRTGKGGWLFGAALRKGGLDVANYANTVRGQRLTLKHGNALGRRLRSRRSVNIPPQLPDGRTHYFLPMGSPVVSFTSTGAVVLNLYESDRRVAASRLLAAVLRG